jgi:hypothetical protein
VFRITSLRCDARVAKQSRCYIEGRRPCAIEGAHGFERLDIAIAPPERWELWQNSRGKTVQIEFSDDALNFFWRDSLDEALKQKDANPIRL